MDSLHAAVTTQLDWRRYRDESYIVGVDPSRKRRVDLRYSLGVDVQWDLDEAEHFLVVPSYALLVSSSNVALSSTDQLPKSAPERFSGICNPAAQARLLNERKVDLVAQVGLCIGHDLILQRECDAPTTTLVVKDRSLDHHSVSALR